MIKAVGKEIARRAHYAIEIAAPGTLGSDERKLADERLAAVHNALLKIGVAEKYIRVKREGDDKKVHLSHDKKTPGNKNTVTVTVKTLEAQQEVKP